MAPRNRVEVLGVILGQVAVVASLLYVGYEVRLNTRVAKAQTHQDLVGLIMTLSDPLIDEIPDVVALRVRADSGLSRMSRTDATRFRTYADRYMSVFELGYYQYREGLLDQEVWTGLRNAAAGYMRRSGFREFWNSERRSYGPQFGAFIDSIVAPSAAVR